MTTPRSFPLNRQQYLQHPGPAGQLEVLTTYPESPRNPPLIAVICHPHPLFGGTLTNKVVTTLAHSFNHMGFSTVRFNFRGVGKSQGEYAEGIGETEDLISLLKWLKTVCPNHAVWLAGFSFGAYVAARGAKKWPIEGLVCVAPPIENFPFKGLLPFQCPWLLVQGNQDEVVSANAVFSWAEGLDKPPMIISLKEATHFFHGHLIQLRESLIRAITPMLKII